MSVYPSQPTCHLKWAILDPHGTPCHSVCVCVCAAIGNMPIHRMPRWLCASAVLKIIGIITDTLTNNLQRKSEYCWAHSSETQTLKSQVNITGFRFCWAPVENQRQCRNNNLLISTNILHASRFTSRRSIRPGESCPLTFLFITMTVALLRHNPKKCTVWNLPSFANCKTSTII